MADSGDAAEDERASENDEEPENIGEELATDPSDIVGLLGHLYRGQMDRVTSWRSRLDQTSYWAVTTWPLS